MFDPALLPRSLASVDDDALGARVEDAGLNAAQPPEQLLHDGWLLRFSPGKARRARSVNAIADGRLPLAEKIGRCRDWYARFGLPCLFRITPFTRPRQLDAELARAGFVAVEPTRVMSLSMPLAAEPPRCRMRELGIDEFAREVGRLRGSPTGQIAAHAARMTASPSSRQARRLALIDGGHVVAAGQAVREFELVGLYDIVTAEHARGRGLATALTIELLQRASQDGAGTAYLQVSADNAAARHLYGKLGFVDRYVYWYRAEPDAAEPQQR